MAGDTTKLIIELETVLRGLNKTLQGLDRVKKKLDSIAAVKLTGGRAGAAEDRVRVATDRLAQSQAKLVAGKKKINAEDTKFAEQQRRFQKTFEAESRRQQKAAESLQRQRSAALVRQFKDQEREQERARKSVLTLDQSLSRVGGSLRNLGLGLTSLGSSLSIALTAPLTALGVIATQNAVTLDSLKRGLEAIVGSASEAGAQLERLTEIAKLPGIGFQEAIQGSIRLQAVGFSAEVAEKALREFANAVALTGGGRAELDRITVQLGQLQSKGKVLAQDLKPIIEAGPAVGKALREAFGTVNSEDIQALGLSSEQFIARLIRQLEELPRAAAGARNTLDNFADAVFRATAAIGEAILPVLTKLINFFEPIITGLANGFKSLPPILQVLIITLGTLLAAAGPLLFVFGQFATGIGGLISAFARLHALGLLPTIAGFRLLAQVMAGTASLAAGQAATTAAAAAGWIALGGAVAIAATALVLIVSAITAYATEQKKAVKVTDEQIKATSDQIESLEKQLKFIDGLKDGVERTADEQERLADIYGRLNREAQIRVTSIADEEKRTKALREELQRILNLRNEERIQQAANLAASLTSTARNAQIHEDELRKIAERVRANTKLRETLIAGGKATAEDAKVRRLFNVRYGDTTVVIRALQAENEQLIDSQARVRTDADKLTDTAKEQGRALKTLQEQTGLSTRQLLTAAKAMGIFKGDIEKTLPLIDAYIEGIREATGVTDEFQRALDKQSQDLLKSGEGVENLIKADKALVEAAAKVAKEATNSFAGALKTLEAFIAAQPLLAQAIENERRRSGKSLGEFLNDILTDGTRKGGEQLRNARERLANALLDIGSAEADKQRAQQEASNDRLLQANELSFVKQLRGYREYLETRALLTKQNLDDEIATTAVIASNARLAQTRLTAAAQRSGISDTERLKRQTQAAEQGEKAIRAETKLIELESQRAAIAEELAQVLAEASVQQVADVRQLDIEFAELRGSIEDALNAATAEKFREALQALALTQARLSKQLAEAKKEGNKEQQEELEGAIKLNQSQIDLIELITEQELAANKLAAAQEFVRRAKEQQAELERQIAFDVEFRGLKEEEAVQRRLAGEVKLANSLRVVRDLVQAEIDALNAKRVKPPQALIEFIRETNAALRGLGELPFAEQFRIAEQEFNRINDERLRKIADIERAIRERDIAEIEGMLIIRRINGQYTGDLERQLELLRQIAGRSNDASLQRQAQAAEDTVKDAVSQLADFDKQLRSTSIDALRDGFTEFFISLTDRTRSAKEKLLDLVNSVANRINQVIAENLSERLIESLFGSGNEKGKVLGGLFGGKKDSEGLAKTALGAAKGDAVISTAALTTGATTAGATIVAAGASFAATIISAGAAFAATIVSTSAASQGAQFARFIGGGASGLFPAVPGGVYKFVEGRHPEAVLTTDPKHAARQVAILRAFLRETRGLGGRIKSFAVGGFISPHEAQSMILGGLSGGPRVSNANIGEMAIAGTPSMMRLRQVLVDQRSFRDWATSSEAETVLVDFLHRHAPIIRQIGGKK